MTINSNVPVEGQFAGKVAMGTGAASGIGRAIALAFAREGASLAIGDINEAGLTKTAEMIGKRCCQALPLDVADEDDVENFVRSVLIRFGRLDCAANAAGFITNGTRSMADFSLADFEKVMRVNVTGIFLCMRAQIRALLEGDGGAIVNIGSSASFVGTPGLAPYVASKHAVLGITKSAAADYAARGIRINAVCPGFVRTPLSMGAIAEMTQEQRQAIMASAPIGRISEPEEPAEAVLFLCSDRASYAVGHGLVIDGGLTVV